MGLDAWELNSFLYQLAYGNIVSLKVMELINDVKGGLTVLPLPQSFGTQMPQHKPDESNNKDTS